MQSQPFFGPRLKVQRANRHISELNRKINAFRKRKPYRFVIQQTSDPETSLLVVRVKGTLPIELPTIIGDAVHNLRAALDLLACDLVRYNGGNAKDVHFPFCETVNDLEAMIKKRHIDRASPEVVDIIRGLKPYKGGNDALRALHELDITDKHKLLIPATVITAIPDFTAVKGEAPTVTMIDGKVRNPIDGRVLVRMSTPDEVKVHKNIKAPFDVVFDEEHEEQPFEFEPIVPTLHQLSELVHGIIDTFISHFAKSPNKYIP